MTKRIVIATAVLLLFAGGSFAQVPNMGFEWTAPTTGNPAVEYLVELYAAGTLISTTQVDLAFFEFEAEPFIEYTLRVAGIDVTGETGEFSDLSDPESFTLGPPGQPGKPYRVN